MEELDKTKILESISKVVEPKEKKIKKKKHSGVEKMTFWCTSCTQNFEINLKDERGNLLTPQQVCVHVTLKQIKMRK